MKHFVNVQVCRPGPEGEAFVMHDKLSNDGEMLTVLYTLYITGM